MTEPLEREPSAPTDVKAKIQETYDAIAVDYNAWTERSTTTRLHYVEKLVKCLPEDKAGQISMLELGCGAGRPATEKLLSVPNATVFANDLSGAQIELARKNLAAFGDRVTLHQGDMMQLTFDNASLDAVVGLYSLIHLPRDEQVALVGSIAQWLKTGGHLLVNFTPEAFEKGVEPDWLVDKGWMFWSGWGPERMLEILDAAGLEVLESELRGDPGDAVFFWVIARKR